MLSRFLWGQQSRKRAKGALEWLGDESRKNETWVCVNSSGKELLFVYPSILPKTPIKLAIIFGTQDSDNSEARFSNVAKDAINTLKGISKDLETLNLSVFSLKENGQGQNKSCFPPKLYRTTTC